ncbi:hypothetical protein A2697_00640 [Candidatus Curtissbacteria bacterium RIFCSPHIGHO2_01_FULL_41_44]|nr:MAG: hypothetical protein A2697_00640 [Candidatus Curtissbacteria bacterium RIFCSPHIGHO2_01_FULL_41_44]OGE02847.1 MAG: hypothetical protein A3G16_05180 [Candidatus Curtissbacteria bacterium RIFCSPLOWO2_12_FULL_41_16]OGE11260.1 MAG: hypothetical protein A3H87_03250 [Candidatus Curtissbacteria bacterium RIFCSPLOWO2_02_FULL_42_37]
MRKLIAAVLILLSGFSLGLLVSIAALLKSFGASGKEPGFPQLLLLLGLPPLIISGAISFCVFQRNKLLAFALTVLAIGSSFVAFLVLIFYLKNFS